MTDRKSWFNRLAFLVVSLAIALGALYGYLSSATQTTFVSPVVLGAVDDSGRSPFAGLLALKSAALTKALPDFGKVLGLTTTGTALPEAKKSLSPTPSQTSKTSSVSVGSSTPEATTTSSTSSISSTSNSSSSNPTNVAPSSPGNAYTPGQQAVEDATNLIISYLKTANYVGLYNLMGQDFKNTFSRDDFVGSFGGSATVSTAQILGAPRVYGNNNEWAEQAVSLNLSSAGSQKYLNVYHFEGSAWTLFGTEEQ